MTTGTQHGGPGRSAAARGARRALAAALVTALWATLGTALAASPASAADEVHAVPASRTWQVEGRGWGHGIGMSQWGAQGAALRGLSAEQILDFYYPGTVRFDIGQDYPLRVRLLSLAGATMTAGPTAGAALVVTDVATGQTQTAPVGARVEVRRSAAGFTAVANGSALVLGGRTTVTGPVEVSGSGGTEVWAYAADGSGVRYSGSLRAAPTGQSTLEVINHVPMEQYLRGVVPRESPASWAPAALQAQAVAARSYALSVRAPSGTADLCDTTQCQVYGGNAGVTRAGVVTERRHPNTDAAIAATARITRYYGGAPAFTQFSSSNGGHSRAGSRPYLVAKPDPYTGTAPGDSVSRWTATLSADRVQASCPSGGTLQRMSLRRDGNGDLGGRITSATLICSTGTATVQTPAFGLLSSWWSPSGTGSPVGNLEVLRGVPGGVQVRGWALDPGTSDPVYVWVDTSGTGRPLRADLARPDVAAAYPGYGAAHGFDAVVPAAPGPVRVCVTAVNTGAGSDVSLRCSTVTVPDASPVGYVDNLLGGLGSIEVRGWALDPETPDPVYVWVDVSGAGRPVLASAPRPDVAAAYPGAGPNHGFDLDVPAPAGTHIVCVTAVNRGSGSDRPLTCKTVTVADPSPTGQVDGVAGVPGGIRVSGWALDPETPAPTYVWLDVAGAGRPVLADAMRRDVGLAFPTLGPRHGFDVRVAAPPGRHLLCATAVNVGRGTDRPLGCRPVTVPVA